MGNISSAKPTLRFFGIALLLVGAGNVYGQSAAMGEPWYPSRYGAADRLGALNNLSAEKTRQAAGLVTEGKVYSLAVVSSAETPALGERTYQVDVYPFFDAPQGENLMSGMDDRIVAHMGIGTQIDGMGHLGIDFKHYNGVSADEMLEDGRLTVFGMQDFPPVVTRGVLLDIAALKGVERLAAGTPIGREEIDAAMQRQGVNVEQGDVVLLHTGWMSLMYTDSETFLASEPGLSVDGAHYLAGLGVVAVGADNSALEHVPFADPERLYEVHQVLLAQNGVYILEFIRTEELVRDGVDEFLFVLSPPRFDGTAQVIVNPVAIR